MEKLQLPSFATFMFSVLKHEKKRGTIPHPFHYTVNRLIVVAGFEAGLDSWLGTRRLGWPNSRGERFVLIC